MPESVNPQSLSSPEWLSLASEARLPRSHWTEGWLRLRLMGESVTRNEAVRALSKIRAHAAISRIESRT